MTLSPKTLEQLVADRDELLKTIVRLEMGCLAEKKKADEYEFFRNDKKYDSVAMDMQATRSLENAKAIQVVLDVEKEKLAVVSNRIADATKILGAHGTHPCLMGSVPHNWQVISRHPSGRFSHRRCVACSTTEKVGCV